MSSRCYDANISSLWKNVGHSGDLKRGGGLCIYLFFPSICLLLFFDVNKSVY